MNKKEVREFYIKKIDEVNKRLLTEKDEKRKSALLELKNLYQGVMDREG